MGWEWREEPWAIDVVRGVVERAVCVSVVSWWTGVDGNVYLHSTVDMIFRVL